MYIICIGKKWIFGRKFSDLFTKNLSSQKNELLLNKNHIKTT